MFKSTRRTCNVQPFSSDVGVAKDIPIVDGALACGYPCVGEVCVLVVRNALYVPSMDQPDSTFHDESWRCCCK